MVKISFNSHTDNETPTKTEEKHGMRRAITALAESCYEHQLNRLERIIQFQQTRITKLQDDKNRLEQLCSNLLEQNTELKDFGYVNNSVQLHEVQATLEEYPYLLPKKIVNVDKNSKEMVGGFLHQEQPIGRNECTNPHEDTLILERESQIFVDEEWGDSEIHQPQPPSQYDTLIIQSEQSTDSVMEDYELLEI